MVEAICETGVCDLGERGVCYEVYSLAGRPGWGVIFEGGRYDGFSPDEFLSMLRVTGHCGAVSDYRFTSGSRLMRDFDSGRFDPAFA
jgi:hypothetical protein